MFKIEKKYTFLAFLLSNVMLYGNIGGTVFEEFPLNNLTLNNYGHRESNEVGVEGVKVTVYPSGDITHTLVDGTWSLSASGIVRVEFSDWPTYLKESPDGNFTHSSVYFVEDGNSSVDFGLYNVNNYTNTVNPSYVTNIISNGSGVDNTIPAIISNNYSDTGLNALFKDYDDIQGTGDIFKVDLNASSIGTVWGKGYQSSQKRMFISSVLWRHAGFALGNPARIFALDYSQSPAQLIGSFDLNGLGSVDRTTNSNYTLDNNSSAPSVDFDAYAKIGKISYGDLDFDNNTQRIWTVNLNEKKIISLDASSSNLNTIASTVQSYPISVGAPTCVGGELRPWGLGIHEDKGYLGIICDASLSQNTGDLKAYVSQFDLNNPSNLTTVLSIDMDYDRKTLADGIQGLRTFQPWSDERHDGFINLDYHNQPILSDIDFDAKGNMYLAFLDRFALQVGHRNYAKKLGARFLLERVQGYGEIFMVCNDNGTFSLEGTGTCPSGQSRNGDVDFFDDKGGDSNANPIGGALAILSGSNQILATSGDPHPSNDYGRTYWTTNGVQTFNSNTGEIENWYAHLYAGDRQYTGKSIGMGDIELLSDPAPIELGNRIWLDNNKNGIQDGNEQGLAGIKVQLIKNNQLIAEVLTDNRGYYLFSNNTNQSSTQSQQYGISQLTMNDNYIIRVPNIKGVGQQTELRNRRLTLLNQGEGTTPDLNDNDGRLQVDHAEITVVPSDLEYGQNNHSFDFGFQSTITPGITPPVPINPQLFVLGNRVWIDSNRDGIQDNNESGRAGINVNLYNNGNCSGTPSQQTITDNAGEYLFSNLPAGNYCIVFTNLPQDYNITTVNQGGNNAFDSDANSQAQIRNIVLNANDRDEDMGIFRSVVAGVNRTECSSMIIEDDIEDANRTNATTIINVLDNDRGTKDGLRVRLVAIEEGIKIWENQNNFPSTGTTVDTLTVPNEGVWRVENNRLIFTAFNAFNGKVPSPVYYVVEGVDCTNNTRYTNVARVSIATACTCPDYTENSVGINSSIFSLGLIALLFSLFILFVQREKLN